jgi:hypothetical protein
LNSTEAAVAAASATAVRTPSRKPRRRLTSPYWHIGG